MYTWAAAGLRALPRKETMLDFLAQAIKDVVAPPGWGGILVGGGGLTLGGAALYLAKRKFIKVCDHIDDQTKHVDPQNGYVRKSMCERNFVELKADISKVDSSVQLLHQRIDRALEKQ